MQKTSDAYEKLYHYTTWDGLWGILQNQSLWATHCKFLNDYSEIVLFKPKLIEFLHPYFLEELEKIKKTNSDFTKLINDNGGLDVVIEHEVEVMASALYDTTGDELYITSFCGEHKDQDTRNNGLLSQWRGYGKDGGFAVVFGTKKLEEVLQVEYDRFDYMGFMLADLVYSNDEERFKSELSDQMHIIAKYIIEGYRMNIGQIIAKGQSAENLPAAFIQLAQKALPAFIRCVSTYKHRGFKEENEVRIVAMPQPQNYRKQDEQDGASAKPDKKREFRDKNGERVPYIELFNSQDIILPIERIIVGPHKEKEARASALRIILRNTDIDVTVSDIPYIS